MTSRRVLVHGSFASLAILTASIKQALEISCCLANDLGQVLHINASVGVFLDLQSFLLLTDNLLLFLVNLLAITVELTEQIKDIFVVNFEICTAHQELLSTLLFVINKAKNVVNRLWNDSFQVLTI